MLTVPRVHRANTATKKLQKPVNIAMPVILRRMPGILIARLADQVHLPTKKVQSLVTVANKAGIPMWREPSTVKCARKANPLPTRISLVSCAKAVTPHRKRKWLNAKHAYPVLMPMVRAIQPVHCVSRAKPSVSCMRTPVINAPRGKLNPKPDRRWSIAPIAKWVFLRIKKVWQLVKVVALVITMILHAKNHVCRA